MLPRLCNVKATLWPYKGALYAQNAQSMLLSNTLFFSYLSVFSGETGIHIVAQQYYYERHIDRQCEYTLKYTRKESLLTLFCVQCLRFG
jgi:hypothetical protein